MKRADKKRLLVWLSSALNDHVFLLSHVSETLAVSDSRHDRRQFATERSVAEPACRCLRRFVDLRVPWRCEIR
jgi:hypothetical protein